MSSPRDKIEAKLGLTGPPLQRVRESPPTIPAHELLRRIGQGAYGEVWLARNALRTWRAVKIVYRDNFKDDRPYEREFAGIRRFEPLSRSNEGFVDVLQVGRDDAEGYFYYVMELADDASNNTLRMEVLRDSQASPANGEPGTRGTLPSDDYAPRTLARDLAHRCRLPLEDCLELGLTLTLALGHLHRHGLIHRDIKPSNIIYVGGVPKLADIGLVTEAQGANTFVGTEGFVPPEGPTSPQADLYALGKVLYEAGMGKDRNEFPEPFTQIGTDRESIALMELNAVLLRACAPDSKKRYGSAEEMHADLALLHSGGSVKRRHQFDRQFQVAKQVGAVAIAATLLIGGAWLWQRQQIQRITQLANEKSTLATEKTKLADNLAKLGEENRNRMVRLDIANGVRLLDEGDPGGALLWFADALPRLTIPAEESINRIRIQQTLHQLPRPAQVLVHEQAVSSMAFDPDGKLLATGTEAGWVQLWDTQTGRQEMKPLHLGNDAVRQIGFTSDSRRLFASTVQGHPVSLIEQAQGQVYHPEQSNMVSAAVIDIASGQQVFTKAAANLLRAEFIAKARWLATADPDHAIRVFDVGDGREVAVLKGHTNSILSLSCPGEGKVLVSSSADGTTRLWRMPAGESIDAPILFQADQHPPVLSDDGQRLATRERMVRDGISEDVIRVWKTDTLKAFGKPIAAAGVFGEMWFDEKVSQHLFSYFGGELRQFDTDTQVELSAPIRFDKPCRLYAGTRDRLIVGDQDRVHGLWDLQTGQVLAPSFRLGQPIVDIALSPDGAQLATIVGEGTCVLWRMNPHREDAVHRLDATVPGSAKYSPHRFDRAFSRDRRRFLTTFDIHKARLVDVEQMTERELLSGVHTNAWFGRVSFAPDNHQWAIARNPGDDQESAFVELWHDQGGTLKHQVLPHPARSQHTRFGSRNSIVDVWPLEEGYPMYYVGDARLLMIQDMVFSPGGEKLTTVSSDRQIRIWRTGDGTLERCVTPPETIEESGVLFPDARTLLMVDRKAGFVLFDLSTERVSPIGIGPGRVTAVAFDALGERFATVTEQGWGRVWSTKSGAPLSPPVRHDGPLTWADWSPDGQRVAMAGITPEVRVWDAFTGELSLPLLHIGENAVGTVTWSLDGRFLVARSRERLVRVWDAATGEPVTPRLKHNGEILFARLAANNRLITLSTPNLIRAWDLAESQLSADVVADYAKLVSGRRMSATGVMFPLKPDELAELCQSLHARAPELFASP